jgi:hypothetical protein
MLERSKRRISIDLVEVVVEVDEEVDPMRTTEVPGALGTLVVILNPVVILTVIRDMPTHAQAMSVHGVVEVEVGADAQLDRKTDKRTNVLLKGSSLPRIRIVVWVPRRAMRSGSRR